jgi:hypothetical protein
MRGGWAGVPARGGFFMWGIIGAVLLLMWLLGFVAFHVTVGFVHILLVLAVISILYHFVAGRSATV